MDNLRPLADELAKPAYASMTNVQAATALNTANVSRNRVIVPAREIIGATTPAEWTALSAAEKQRYQTITGAGEVDVTNANVRAAFTAMFAAGTATRTALTALLTETVSQATVLGLGTVTEYDVARARGGSW